MAVLIMTTKLEATTSALTHMHAATEALARLFALALSDLEHTDFKPGTIV